MTHSNDQLEADLRRSLHTQAERLVVSRPVFVPGPAPRRPDADRRRLVLIGTALVVVVAALIGWAVWSRRSPTSTVVDTGTSGGHVSQPAPALDPTVTPRPAGPVSVLADGAFGDAEWWMVSYEAMTGNPDVESWCVWMLDPHGRPYSGSGGCEGGTRGGTVSGSGFGWAHVGDQDLLLAQAGLEVDAIHAEFTDGTTASADLHPVPGADRQAWLLALPTHGGADDYWDRARAALRSVYLVADGRREGVYPDPLTAGGITTTTVEHAPAAYCAAVEAFRASGTTAPDGSIEAAAVPYLRAIADASPPEIRAASQAMVDAVSAGRQPGAEAGETTQYWAAHC